ncbi:sodium:solute symporter family transporter [Agaribacter flavus]|uniref:Sodium/solute symporter n=1 Tax=Agaribacter flavus TaxID=1902781 RepID=A0ABV7FQ96_9ALTE
MNIWDFLTIGLYLAGLLIMGVILRHQADKKDYFLAGRSLGWKPLSLSIMATQLSAISFVSAPAFVGLREGGGLVWLSYELALPLAMLFLLWKILPSLHRAGVVSVYDYLEQRFNLHTRVLLSFVFQISRSFATAIMIYAVSVILQGAIGLAFWQSIVAIGLITVVYSLQGGMKAVVYGDALQMVLIVLGTIVCLAYGLYHIGGLEQFWSWLEPGRMQTLRFDAYGFDGQGFGFWPMLFGGIILYASYYGCDQSEAQRALSAKNTIDLKKMIFAASILRFPITLLYCGAGLIIGTFALNTPEFLDKIPEGKPDWMMPVFIVNYMPNGVIGLLIVAILAAAMSSLSSAINSLSAVSVEDYCRLTKQSLSNSQYLLRARFVGIAWGLVTLLLSFFAGDIAPTVIEAINKVGSLFYGPILACFFLGLSTQSVMGKHVNLGLIAGVLTNMVFWLFVDGVFWFWWNVIGFVVTTTVSLALSRLLATKALPEPQIVNEYSAKSGNDLNRIDIAILLAWFIVILSVCILLGG